MFLYRSFSCRRISDAIAAEAGQRHGRALRIMRTSLAVMLLPMTQVVDEVVAYFAICDLTSLSTTIRLSVR